MTATGAGFSAPICINIIYTYIYSIIHIFPKIQYSGSCGNAALTWRATHYSDCDSDSDSDRSRTPARPRLGFSRSRHRSRRCDSAGHVAGHVDVNQLVTSPVTSMCSSWHRSSRLRVTATRKQRLGNSDSETAGRCADRPRRGHDTVTRDHSTVMNLSRKTTVRSRRRHARSRGGPGVVTGCSRGGHVGHGAVTGRPWGGYGRSRLVTSGHGAVTVWSWFGPGAVTRGHIPSALITT